GLEVEAEEAGARDVSAADPVGVVAEIATVEVVEGEPEAKTVREPEHGRRFESEGNAHEAEYPPEGAAGAAAVGRARGSDRSAGVEIEPGNDLREHRAAEIVEAVQLRHAGRVQVGRRGIVGRGTGAGI